MLVNPFITMSLEKQERAIRYSALRLRNLYQDLEYRTRTTKSVVNESSHGPDWLFLRINAKLFRSNQALKSMLMIYGWVIGIINEPNGIWVQFENQEQAEDAMRAAKNERIRVGKNIIKCRQGSSE